MGNSKIMSKLHEKIVVKLIDAGIYFGMSAATAMRAIEGDIEKALDKARREGAEDMRERAASLVGESPVRVLGDGTTMKVLGSPRLGNGLALAIRTLPLDPEQ